MKKLLSMVAIALMVISTSLVNAQSTVTRKTTTESTSSVHLKKDGTPDKRFKENKTTTTVHLKKDGTPDKRFKENKTTTTKTVIKKK